MYEIEKTEWEKVFEVGNHNFENDFNNIILKHIKNSKDIINQQGGGFFEKRKKLHHISLIEEVLTKKNWLAELRVYGQSFLRNRELILRQYETIISLFDELRNNG